MCAFLTMGAWFDILRKVSFPSKTRSWWFWRVTPLYPPTQARALHQMHSQNIKVILTLQVTNFKRLSGSSRYMNPFSFFTTRLYLDPFILKKWPILWSPVVILSSSLCWKNAMCYSNPAWFILHFFLQWQTGICCLQEVQPTHHFLHF